MIYDEIYAYRGKEVDKMTREEIIEMSNRIARENASLRKDKLKLELDAVKMRAEHAKEMRKGFRLW